MTTIEDVYLEDAVRTAVAAATQDIRQAIRDLRSEVDCRIQHGAESGGHLDYVLVKLNKILEAYE